MDYVLFFLSMDKGVGGNGITVALGDVSKHKV